MILPSFQVKIRQGPQVIHVYDAAVLNFTVPCPPLVKTDCEGIWLGFGECEANSTQLLRFAIEVNAAAGGQPCPHLEGETKRVDC